MNHVSAKLLYAFQVEDDGKSSSFNWYWSWAKDIVNSFLRQYFLDYLGIVTDMSNSIETRIDIDFFEGIDIGIDIDSGYPWKIDIGIDIDFLNFERLTLALTLTFLSSMSMGNQNTLKLSV